MGARSGGGAGGGMGSRSRGGGYSSGIGSGKSYGLDKYEKFAFEAIKSDASYNGNVWETTSGQKIYSPTALGGRYFTESALAAEIKSQFKSGMSKTGKSPKALAAQVTKYMTNIKTGDFFGNMADNI